MSFCNYPSHLYKNACFALFKYTQRLVWSSWTPTPSQQWGAVSLYFTTLMTTPWSPLVKWCQLKIHVRFMFMTHFALRWLHTFPIVSCHSAVLSYGGKWRTVYEGLSCEENTRMCSCKFGYKTSTSTHFLNVWNYSWIPFLCPELFS